MTKSLHPLVINSDTYITPRVSIKKKKGNKKYYKANQSIEFSCILSDIRWMDIFFMLVLLVSFSL